MSKEAQLPSRTITLRYFRLFYFIQVSKLQIVMNCIVYPVCAKNPSLNLKSFSSHRTLKPINIVQYLYFLQVNLTLEPPHPTPKISVRP